MNKGKHISLIYQYNDKWIGGTYYILNIIRALNFLNEDQKPFLTIYYSQGSSLVDLENINYPKIEYVEFTLNWSFIKKAINKTGIELFNRQWFTKKLPAKRVSNFYFKTFDIDSSNIDNYYFWIADLQDLCLPHFFSKNELRMRLKTYKQMIKKKEPIVFSSVSAGKDFDRFFPGNQNIKKILPFVSINNLDYKNLSFFDLKAKFKITGSYYIVSNQFWRHKNHLTVLKAFLLFNKTNKGFQLLLTGKEYDHRDPNYTDELKEYIKANNLNEDVKFLGFIDRNEQLKLMSESIAIIQPSLFEGWSTVVEDAKFFKPSYNLLKHPGASRAIRIRWNIF